MLQELLPQPKLSLRLPERVVLPQPHHPAPLTWVPSPMFSSRLQRPPSGLQRGPLELTNGDSYCLALKTRRATNLAALASGVWWSLEISGGLQQGLPAGAH